MSLPVPVRARRSRIHSGIARMFDTHPECVVRTNSSVRVGVVSICYCCGSLGMWQLLLGVVRT